MSALRQVTACSMNCLLATEHTSDVSFPADSAMLKEAFEQKVGPQSTPALHLSR